MKCQMCGEDFERAQHGRRKYCSGSCLSASRSRRNRKRLSLGDCVQNDQLLVRTCPICESEFSLSGSGRTVYCSEICLKESTSRAGRKSVAILRRQRALRKINLLFAPKCAKTVQKSTDI